MDIPNTGAIFTLGKSYLAENTQSYFYIKKDPFKRLIAGPSQSAVICESGRLFVWGENVHGQLGIGNNNNNGNGDLINKPTCVKSLKTLGLKIADISFGIDWSIILTISNEIFFTGRNIFAHDCTVSRKFAETTVNGEVCEITRKPFRLEEFVDCLSNSEEPENFINVLAGNEHFVLLTSFGRLFGWGSNQSHQLGKSKDDIILRPHEIVLNSPIRKYTCGPESTLVLTENGKLYLTGRLNEFVFPGFQELQKNLSSNEEIIFMNISKASEIFIVTNAGSVYRSYESVRNKSLIFQRFYDYDSEENGPIWKLLKGTSFYAVLSKTNKFYTTFSESGHHLKTFREISKFKNLRIIDLALGDQHILVHGIPRSSTLASTVNSVSEHRYMAQSVLMANTTAGISSRMDQSVILDETSLNQENTEIKETTTFHLMEEKKDLLETKEETSHINNSNNIKRVTQDETEKETSNSNNNEDVRESEESIESFETDNTVVNKGSPTQSLKSETTSISSHKKEKIIALSAKSVRPRTPFPESGSHDSPLSTSKKTPKRNLSYEVAINNDFIKDTAPAVVESLDNIPELVTKENEGVPNFTVSESTPPTEDDEELRLEISEATDPLDHTVTVNEIRFINNGIDVTANVKKLKSDSSDDSLDVTEDEDNEKDEDIDKKLKIRKQAEDFIGELENEIDKKAEIVQENLQEERKLYESRKKSIDHTVQETVKSMDCKLTGGKKVLESAAEKVATESRETARNFTDKTQKVAKGAKQSIENISNAIDNRSDNARQAVTQMGNNLAKATGEAKDSMNNAFRKIAGDTKQAMDSVTSKITTEVQDAKNSLNSMLQYKKNKVDIQKPISAEDDIQSEATSKESGGGKSNTTTGSNNTGVQEDDERTTVSANSNHTVSAGNPFESTDPFDPELDAMIQRGKQALREELQQASVAVRNRTQPIVEEVAEDKTKFSKFLDDIREKSKGLSCRNEKSIRIIEDQPPRYSVDDEFTAPQVNSHSPANGSKVCTIL